MLSSQSELYGAESDRESYFVKFDGTTLAILPTVCRHISRRVSALHLGQYPKPAVRPEPQIARACKRDVRRRQESPQVVEDWPVEFSAKYRCGY